MNRISFLVIAYNGLESTIRCLKSLLAFEAGEEILVLDNGSNEPFFSTITSEFASEGVTVFRSEENLGVVGGRNYLLEKATGGILVFVDNDVELTGTVGGKIKENLADQPVGVYGKTGIMLSDKLEPFVVTDREVDVVTGFFQCFRRDLVNEIGILDENFTIYGQEDFDFCLRAKQAGYKITADVSLPLVHREHQSSSTIKNLKDFEIKNREYFYNKWRNSLEILEIERKKINRLSCLNCANVWEREK